MKTKVGSCVCVQCVVEVSAKNGNFAVYFFCLKEACDLVEHSHHFFGVVFVIFLFLLCCVCFHSNNEVGFVWVKRWLCCKFSSLLILSRTKGENMISKGTIRSFGPVH